MPILQIFRKDKKEWSEMQVEQIELYLSLHPFFSKFYQYEDFNTILNILFYAKVRDNQQKILEFNKKTQILILLSGEIQIYRKMAERQNKGKIKKRKIIHENYIWKGMYKKNYEIIELREDSIIKSIENQQAQFLYLPTILYQTHIQLVKKRRSAKIIQALQLRFRNAPKRDLSDLAEFASQFKEFKINNQLYRAGTAPEACYILIKGVVRLQSILVSAKKLLDIHFVNQNDLFGVEDLQQQQRSHSAICGSSYCSILSIKKDNFLKFMIKNQQYFKKQSQKLKGLLKQRQRSLSAIKSYQTKLILPKIRLQSALKPQQQKKIQSQMLQNCHSLINYGCDKKSSNSFRISSARHEDEQYTDQFKIKLNLYKKLKQKSKPINLTYKLF